MQETKVYFTFSFEANTDAKFEAKMMILEGLIENFRTDLEEEDIYIDDMEWK